MWTNRTGPFGSMDLHTLSEPLGFVAQLQYAISNSILRAQAEGIGRGAQDIEHEIELLQSPPAQETPAAVGLGHLALSAISRVLPEPTARQATIHVLRANSESLRAAEAICRAVISRLEQCAHPPAPPEPQSAQKVPVT